MFVLSSARSPAGIQYSTIVRPPTWWVSEWSRNDRRTRKRVTYPLPECLTGKARSGGAWACHGATVGATSTGVCGSSGAVCAGVSGEG